MSELRFGQAINRALADAMAADPSVILLGEDVGAAGGSFGVTRGLQGKFGAAARARHADLRGDDRRRGRRRGDERAQAGGRDHVHGFRHARHGRAGQPGGQGALHVRRPSARVPMVLRMPHGGGLVAGPQHSQCLEAWFAHVPGLKVRVPVQSGPTPTALLRAAIEDPDPVIFVEHKALYADKGEVDTPALRVPIGKAAHRPRRPRRDDRHLRRRCARRASQAAAQLAADGIEAEVIDLRSLQPWDEAAVLASVAKTHRLVVVHEAVEAFGVGAEIAARMADVGFDELDAPIVRVAAPFMPVPFARTLEDWYRPDAQRIAAGVRRTLA